MLSVSPAGGRGGWRYARGIPEVQLERDVPSSGHSHQRRKQLWDCAGRNIFPRLIFKKRPRWNHKPAEAIVFTDGGSSPVISMWWPSAGSTKALCVREKDLEVSWSCNDGTIACPWTHQGSEAWWWLCLRECVCVLQSEGKTLEDKQKLSSR